jgi:hypothetical protein
VSFVKLTFTPGINRDQTDYSGEGGWWACNRARFRSGFPESIGGWVKRTPTAFHGVSRGMHNWTTTFGDNLLAIGTNNKLYIEAGGLFYDITPLREGDPVLSTPVTDNSISTVLDSKLVTVALSGPHEVVVANSFVTVSGVVGPIGGIPDTELNGNHQIIDILSPTAFTYYVDTPATATAGPAGGVAITLSFEIEPGLSTGLSGYGWGVGPWGRNSWGLGANKPVQIAQRDWFYDNIDDDLVANIRNGPIYYWTRGPSVDPQPSLHERAVLLKDLAAADGFDPNAVPGKVMQISMSQQDRHLIAFGATPFGFPDSAFDPLLIRWADQDNWTQWTPTPLNSAGFIKVSRGSRIIRALPTRQEYLVWTDAKLYALQFLGTTDVFGLQEYAETISIMSPRSVITASNVTYWMGQDKFYAYTGRVETLPCTLRDHVFNNINRGETDNVVCGLNEQWNEVWWFYPSALAQFNDSYVIYNYAEQVWYYGDIDRTAWLDSPMRDVPQATRITGDPLTPEQPTLMSYLMNHETGTDDDQLPLNSYIETNDFDLGDGDNFMLTRRLLPDVSFDGSLINDPEVQMQVRPRNFPGQNPFPDIEDTQTIASMNITNYTEQVFIRARARQMAYRLMSNKLGVSWQLGNCRLDVRPDGRR